MRCVVDSVRVTGAPYRSLNQRPLISHWVRSAVRRLHSPLGAGRAHAAAAAETTFDE